MKIRLQTEVDGHYQQVMEGFDLDLFEALKPKLGKMDVLEFTGSKKGDIVRLQFTLPIKAEWVSHIVEDGIDDNQAYFVDVGTKLPFPLSDWRHRHIVKKVSENRSLIIDDISFIATNFLFTLLMYPALYFAFAARKKVYRQYFSDGK